MAERRDKPSNFAGGRTAEDEIGATMIKTVKCVTKGCEFENRVVSTASRFINRIGPLDGPFICPKCGKTMKVVERYPANKGKSGKTMPRTSSGSTGHKVGKKKNKPGLKIKHGRGALGSPHKKAPKAGQRKQGQRKRGPSKS
jgi:hypothetical protein